MIRFVAEKQMGIYLASLLMGGKCYEAYVLMTLRFIHRFKISHLFSRTRRAQNVD